MAHATKHIRSLPTPLGTRVNNETARASFSIKGLTMLPLSVEANVYHHFSLRTLARLCRLSSSFKARIERFMESEYQGVISTCAFELTDKACFRFLSGARALRGLELFAPCDAANNRLQFSLLEKNQTSLRRLGLNSHHLACAASSMHFPRLTALVLDFDAHDYATVNALMIAAVDVAVVNLFHRHADTITDLDLHFHEQFSKLERNGLGASFLSRTSTPPSPLWSGLGLSRNVNVCSVAGASKADDGPQQLSRPYDPGNELWQDLD